MKALDSFGKYALLEKIAAGGMAEVYLAKSEGAGGIAKLVAIKRILPQYSDNQDFIDMFKEEAKIAVNLNHSNVVSIFDFGIEKGQFFLVMEYVEGQNLRQILNHLKKESRDLTIDQVIYIIKEVAAGLDHAHRCLDSSGRPLNITHRDMSPQNIMISFEGEVKIVDFGIAKAESQVEQTRAGTIKGKFGYMSPEQAEGLPVDVRTDIFSLGIVLWELLTHDRLFVAQSEAATLKKIRDCNIPSLRKIVPTIPPELERICNKALAKDRSLRYQTAAAMHRDLNRFLNTQYPDFSVQDLSVFLKSSFAKLFLENRKKLAAHAKVRVMQQEDKTQVTLTETLTESVAEPSVITGLLNMGVSGQPTGYTNHVIQAPDFEIDPRAKHKVSLNDLAKNDNIPNETNSAENKKPRSNADFSLGGIGGTHSKIKSKRNREMNLSWVAPTMGILLFTLGAWNVWKNDFYGYGPRRLGGAVMTWVRDQIPQSEKPLPNPDLSSVNGGTELTSQAPPVQFTIHTMPSSAVVYIDGKQGGITPFTGFIKPNQIIKISLTRDGYLPYDSVIQGPTSSDRRPMTIRATLQPKPPMGAVSIQLVNGGPGTIITVNKQRLSETPPIAQYPVPANTTIVIEALDPHTQFSTTMRVQVRQDEKKTVKLTLTKRTAGQN